MDVLDMVRVKGQRFCYLRTEKLQEVLTDEVVLDALLLRLEVPGKVQTLARLSPSDKREAIRHQAEHYRSTRTSYWYDVPLEEVLAASLYDSDLPNRTVDALFCSLRREADLLDPVAALLEGKDLAPYDEVPMGKKRIDVAGLRKGGLAGLLGGAHIVGVELKNDIKQLERGLDQMTTFQDYCHEVYLACSPELAASYLFAHGDATAVSHHDPNALNRKLLRFGIGLLLVEHDDVYEHIVPSPHSPDGLHIDEVVSYLDHFEPMSAADH